LREANAAKMVSDQGVLWDGAEEGRALAVVGPFLLAQRGSDILLVDLRSSLHERTMKKASVQALLFPIRLTLTSEEALRMNELMERCAQIGIEAQMLGPKLVCFDAIPDWLDQQSASAFFEALKDDLWRSLPLDETIRRFSQTATKLYTLSDAEAIWKSGSVREVALDAANLERIWARKT
jgi:DNA mismatch repair ATPase MutL